MIALELKRTKEDKFFLDKSIYNDGTLVMICWKFGTVDDRNIKNELWLVSPQFRR